MRDDKQVDMLVSTFKLVKNVVQEGEMPEGMRFGVVVVVFDD